MKNDLRILFKWAVSLRFGDIFKIFTKILKYHKNLDISGTTLKVIIFYHIFITKHGILLTFVFKWAYCHWNILIICLKFVLETRGSKNLFAERVSYSFRNKGYIRTPDIKLYRLVRWILSSTPIKFWKRLLSPPPLRLILFLSIKINFFLKI